MAVDRFHKDKKARAAIARAHESDGDRVRFERSDDGSVLLEPLDAWIERITTDPGPQPGGPSAPISQTYLHPDPDRRALVDQWLADRQRPEAA